MPRRDPGRRKLVERVLADPQYYPDEFNAHIPRLLADNTNFVVSRFQVHDVDGERWHVVAGSGEPVFQNGWLAYGGFYAPPGFRKDYLEVVHLRGMAKSGTINTVIFTLPPGYRPEYVVRVAVDSNGAHGVVEIGANGDVKAAAGNNAWVQLDNISFRAYS